MIIGDGIILGAGGESASIFVTGLSETDSVIATKDGKIVVGKWKRDTTPNPKYIALPNGYTQLEYIKSTGEQYIDTNWVHKANSKIVLSCNVLDSIRDGWLGIFGSANPNYRTNAWMFFSRFGSKNVPAISRTGNETTGSNFFYNEDITITAEGNTASWSGKSGEQSLTASGTVNDGAVSMYLLALHEGTKATRFSVARLYSAQFFTGTVLERDFVPAKRNSDGSIGMYDLVTNAFYENSGTGSFIAGKSVFQYKEGFEIAPIKSYGTWTVENADSTKTADVLIDTATEFEVTL